MATSLRPSSVEAAHIYMASPFALYFYSVYRPGLAFISTNSALSWLSFFFFPHIVVETSSTFVNFHNAIGAALFWVGSLTFCLGAGQVYYHKLARKGAVTGGIYNFIRQPLQDRLHPRDAQKGS
jgi:hypothetical protein